MEHPRNCWQEGRISGPNNYRNTRFLLSSWNYAIKTINFQFKELQRTLKEGHRNNRAHWGVAILNTPLHAIAARVSIGRDVALVSIYNSRSHTINENLFSTLFQQLPKPVILAGDFNRYHQTWESPANYNRGCQVLNFINKNKLNILYDERHTRTSGTSKSVIDLTVATPFYSLS